MKRSDDLVPVASVLSKLIKDLDLDVKMLDHSLLLLWSEFVANSSLPALVRYSKSTEIDKKRFMIIQISSSVLKNELQFVQDDLEKDFLAFLATRISNEPRLGRARPVRGVIFR